MKRVVLHIERLVLCGFRPEERHAIATGLQQELARMLADPVAARQLTGKGDIPKLRIGNIHLGQGAKPRSVGLQVGRGIGKGLKT